MQHPINIGYFIWLEDLTDDVIKGQVFDVVKMIVKDRDEIITIFAFSRTYDFFLEIEQFKKIQRELHQHNLRLIILPIVFFPKRLQLFFAAWYLIPIIIFISWPVMMAVTLFKKIRIIHLRSYPLAPSAILLKAIIPKIKIIFDTRSPFPEESVESGKWPPRSLTFRLWKLIEANALTKFDASVFVTKAHLKLFSKLSEKNVFTVIPNNSASRQEDVNIIENEPTNRLKSYRNSFCFVYVGSLSRRGISNPELYAQVVLHLRKLKFAHSFLFITREGQLLREIFDKHGIARHEYSIESCAPEHVSKRLSRAHAGMNFLNNIDVRMSVKTAEYLSSGLPLLCNENALGTKEIIEEFNVGFFSNLDTLELRVDELFLNYAEFLGRAHKLRNHFSSEKIASEYKKLYEKIILHAF